MNVPAAGADATILVTGGAGFIGSAVVRFLIGQTRHRVVTLDKLTYAGNKLNLADCLSHPKHRFVQGDIADRDIVRAVFSEFDPRVILHLAAESHVDRSIDNPGDFIETNVVGTFVLLEEFRRHLQGMDLDKSRRCRFCCISTDEVFGSLDSDGAFTEESPYDPSSPYSASKAASDHLARAWARTYDLPIIVTNCSNNYGPYQFPEKLIPLMILNGLAGKRLPVYGDGGNVRDWLYVEEHADALYQVVCSGRAGETYNIGSRSERTNLEVVQAICSVLDRLVPSAQSHNCLIDFVQDRPGHDYRYAIDPSKVEREIGWQAKQDFESGLEKTVAWYVDHVDWCQNVQRGISATQRQGLRSPAGSAA